jgi:hypothetical protein
MPSDPEYVPSIYLRWHKRKGSMVLEQAHHRVLDGGGLSDACYWIEVPVHVDDDVSTHRMPAERPVVSGPVAEEGALERRRFHLDEIQRSEHTTNMRSGALALAGMGIPTLIIFKLDKSRHVVWKDGRATNIDMTPEMALKEFL